MRALLGLLLLVGAFLTAAGWQMNRTQRVRAAREQQHGLTSAPRDPEWSLLVLGTISGADPIPAAEEPPLPAPEPPWTSGTGDPLAAPRPEPEYSYVIQRGDNLSGICKQYYGTAEWSLVEAVARYNGLANADALRADDELLLPDRNLLPD